MPGRHDSKQALQTWFDVACKARWQSFADTKRDFGASVDLAHGKFVFDIRGNKYRLVCSIDFIRHGVLVLWIGTHGEYDELNRNDGQKMKLP
jgi:mRNA interferase HigB